MITQVFAPSIVQEDGTLSPQDEIAFGSHPQFPDFAGGVTTIAPIRSKPILVVLDEEVPTNPLNEILCSDGQYAPIPAGLSEEDLIFCSSTRFSPEECPGSVCAPYGFIDVDGDSTPDRRRLIDFDADPDSSEYALNIICDGVLIPLDVEKSGYTKASQLKLPASYLENETPVIFLQAAGITELRTNATCTLQSRPELVDEDGNRVCAPAGGDPQAGCSDGDLSPISFKTQPITLLKSAPANGATNVPLDSSSFIYLEFNARLDEVTVSAVTLKANGAPMDIAPMVRQDDLSSIEIIMGAPFEANSLYELEVSTGLADKLGGTMPTAITISWTTGT